MSTYEENVAIEIGNENIWLQRNNHCGEKAWEALGFDKNGNFMNKKQHLYISIGCKSNKLTENDYKQLLECKDENERWAEFENICKNSLYKGIKLPRYRYSLWRFLFNYKKGDYLLIPSNHQDFHIFRIYSENVITYNSIKESYNLPDKNNDEDFLYFWEVRPVRIKMNRNCFADQALTSRMKIRSTLCCINDLKDNVIKALNSKNRISPYSNAINETSGLLIKSLQKDLNDYKFEKLIEWYFKKINATYTKILPKNTTGNQDADVLAVFDNLKLKIYVQAKKHDEVVNIDKAYMQISEYKKSQPDEDEYKYFYWIICSSINKTEFEQFDTDEIRIIYGTEFAEMLLDVGLSGMDNAFYE